MKIGLELEGFVIDTRVADEAIVIPPSYCPVDSCGSIIELRTQPHEDAFLAFGELDKLVFELTTKLGKEQKKLSFDRGSYKFTPVEKRAALAHSQAGKKDVHCVISNLYGKAQKDWGGKTYSSLQLNFSDSCMETYTIYNSIGSTLVKQFKERINSKLFDFPQLIRKLDAEFDKYITDYKRQPGVYAIKDNGIRIEYRSLSSAAYLDPSIRSIVHQLMTGDL